MKISIEQYEGRFEVVLPDDSNIADVVMHIKGLLVATGFHPENVDEYIDGNKWFNDELEDKEGPV